MNTKTKITIAGQLTQCAMKAVTHANDALDAKGVDQALRALQVCQQALSLLELLSCVPTTIDPPIDE
jgi:hypothetical protein